uniref:RRM domain-containing protein n=1 Tax=Rhodosorus marinus TaxID=101924 RepID=A0A7S0BNL0_9RHOD|mmetsp:Transcript_24564/g.35434  ORF Transcript_24564/g.35434 Transcript_24564/m.35434 type:complete len:428 (+) Transcript_24564:60-1343(+)
MFQGRFSNFTSRLAFRRVSAWSEGGARVGSIRRYDPRQFESFGRSERDADEEPDRRFGEDLTSREASQSSRGYGHISRGRHRDGHGHGVVSGERDADEGPDPRFNDGFEPSRSLPKSYGNNRKIWGPSRRGATSLYHPAPRSTRPAHTRNDLVAWHRQNSTVDKYERDAEPNWNVELEIFLFNLPYSATKREVLDFLEAVAPVHAVKLTEDRERGNCSGVGIAQLYEEGDVQKVIDVLNEQLLNGKRPIGIRRSIPHHRRRYHNHATDFDYYYELLKNAECNPRALLVEHVPRPIQSWENLKDLGKRYGEVLFCSLRSVSEDETIGVLFYKTVEEAGYARTRLNGSKILGDTFRCYRGYDGPLPARWRELNEAGDLGRKLCNLEQEEWERRPQSRERLPQTIRSALPAPSRKPITSGAPAVVKIEIS